MTYISNRNIKKRVSSTVLKIKCSTQSCTSIDGYREPIRTKMLRKNIESISLPSPSLTINKEEWRFSIITDTSLRHLNCIPDSIKNRSLLSVKRLVSQISFMIILIQDIIRKEALLENLFIQPSNVRLRKTKVSQARATSLKKLTNISEDEGKNSVS